ncbi:MAG: response regulator, partial [Desulfobacterales bacterium]|nr:response regulator [Desulfobacterales bacterium]
NALITNAGEAMNELSGKVRVSVDTVNPADIPGGRHFPADRRPSAEARARLAVTDAGLGMDAETIERIFDPFYTSKFTGRGLGLPVVLGIVKAHGGGITVKSEPGRGSAFHVYLPLSSASAPLPEGRPPIDVSAIAGGCVLVVDDQDVVRDLLKIMLKRIGFKVRTAKDGVEAVEKFRENPAGIRLVLSDLSMPRMNGWETLNALRAIRPDIPVILASGYDKAHVMAGDHAEQPQAFLQKPYRMGTLKEILGRVLGGEGGF